MSEPNQEPTMEEILASIRRIISEDDAPPETPDHAPAPAPAAAAPAHPEPEPEPLVESFAHEPEHHPEPPHAPMAHAEEDSVLELTERVEPETHGDIDVYAAPDHPAPAFGQREEEPLVAAATAGVAASAFGHLAQTIAMPRDGRTLEDVVRELLNPLLKAWLDQHLPEIVQAKVEAEVERIARGPRR
jgi:cell pole-organizing protein PopZ